MSKRSLKPKKGVIRRRIEVSFKCIEWFIYIGFCILAGLFVKDVFDQYQSKDTFMGQSLQPITKLPTIVFCFTKYSWDYNEGKVKVFYSTRFNDYNCIKANESLHLDGGNETVNWEQMTNQCFMINNVISSEAKRGVQRYLSIQIPKYVDPPSLRVYFTSKENSYGRFFREWFDGEVLNIDIEFGYKVKLQVKPVEYSYLNQDSKCTNQTFLDQWWPYMTKANFSKCDKKCSHYSTFVSEERPLCGWGTTNLKDRRCAAKAFQGNYNNFKEEVAYVRPCHVSEYHGKIMETKSVKGNQFQLSYTFSPPEMTFEYKERLVFDDVGMIGSVGGTLGMCIGFSFIGMASVVLDIMKSRMISYYL